MDTKTDDKENDRISSDQLMAEVNKYQAKARKDKAKTSNSSQNKHQEIVDYSDRTENSSGQKMMTRLARKVKKDRYNEDDDNEDEEEGFGTNLDSVNSNSDGE